MLSGETGVDPASQAFNNLQVLILSEWLGRKSNGAMPISPGSALD